MIARNLGDDDPNQEVTWPPITQGPLRRDADKTAHASSARVRDGRATLVVLMFLARRIGRS